MRDWTVRKLKLHDEPIEPLIEDRAEAMETFWAILETGQSLYPNDPEQGYPRIYRVVPLKEG